MLILQQVCPVFVATLLESRNIIRPLVTLNLMVKNANITVSCALGCPSTLSFILSFLRLQLNFEGKLVLAPQLASTPIDDFFLLINLTVSNRTQGRTPPEAFGSKGCCLIAL